MALYKWSIVIIITTIIIIIIIIIIIVITVATSGHDAVAQDIMYLDQTEEAAP